MQNEVKTYLIDKIMKEEFIITEVRTNNNPYVDEQGRPRTLSQTCDIRMMLIGVPREMCFLISQEAILRIDK